MVGSGLTGTGTNNADTLLSSGGPNTLVGLGGDDLYYVNNAADVVVEAPNEGFDSVMAFAELYPADQCRGAVHDGLRADRHRQQRRQHAGHHRREHPDRRRRRRHLRVLRRQRQRRDRCRLQPRPGPSGISWCSAASAPRRRARPSRRSAPPTSGRSIPASIATTRSSRSRTTPRCMPGISCSCEARQQLGESQRAHPVAREPSSCGIITAAGQRGCGQISLIKCSG